MAVKFKDFILNWYKAYHLYNMDDPRKQRWRDLRGKEFEINSKGEYVFLDDKRTAAQKGWANPKTGELATELPEPDLSDEDWEYFYRLCRTAIRRINDMRADLLRNDPDKNPLPIDKWFGSKNLKAFSAQEVKPATKDKLKQFAELVVKSPRLKNKLMDSFSSEYSLDTFLADLIDMDYSRNSQHTIPKIQTIIRILPGIVRPEYDFKIGDYKNSLDDETIAGISRIFLKSEYDPDSGLDMDNLEYEFDEMSAELDPANESINEMQLRQFKDPSVYKEILKALYAPDKSEKKSPFNTQFANAGGSEITGYMSEIVTGNNYESGANELVPKFEKELNITEQISEKIDDFKSEHLKRLTDRSARHIYIEPNAKGIVDAIVKEKIAPTDGLEKILEKKDAVTKRVQAKMPGAKKACDFLFDALSYIKSSGDMDKALAGALRNGSKAEAIAFEIIKYAIAKRKVNEAKAALEVLAVMRYDAFSSAHWNELNKTEFNLFGDKKLSWNKNDTMAMVNGAVDKTIKFGINGAFWIGVLARNWIQFGRAKMSTDDVSRMETAMAKIQADSDEFKNLDRAKLEHEEVHGRLNDAKKEFGYAMILRDERNALETEIAALESELPAAKKDADAARYPKLIDAIDAKKTAMAEIDAQLSPHAGEFAKFDKLVADMADVEEQIKSAKGELSTAADDAAIAAAHKKLKTLDLKRGALRVKQEIYNHQKQDYLDLEKEDRVSTELLQRLQSAADRGMAKETESKPYNAPKSDVENMQMLMAFWNAANGFVDGLDVNSYNVFRNIKTVRKEANLQKLFNQMFSEGRI